MARIIGSVRHLADDEATPLLTQTYDPYGTVYASVGAETSSYGYTNEYTDATGLLYLRARYYNPLMGRFLNVDPSRQERNLYEYAVSNPVMFTDPSGLIPEDPKQVDLAYITIAILEISYKVHIPIDFGWYGNDGSGAQILMPYKPSLGLYETISCGSTWASGMWENANELLAFEEQLEKIALKFAEVNGRSSDLAFGRELFRKAMGESVIVRVDVSPYNAPYTINEQVTIPDATFNSPRYTEYSIIHEYGHIWDGASGGALSRGMAIRVRRRNCYAPFRCGPLEIDPAGEGDAPGSYKLEDQPNEDWAQSFTSFIVPFNSMFGTPPDALSPGRDSFIREEIDKLD